MARNVDMQKKYWDLLKNIDWNKTIKDMPKYLVLEDKENMTEKILDISMVLANDIEK